MTDQPNLTDVQPRQLLPIATGRQTWAALRAEFAALPGLSAVAAVLLVAVSATGAIPAGFHAGGELKWGALPATCAAGGSSVSGATPR